MKTFVYSTVAYERDASIQGFHVYFYDGAEEHSVKIHALDKELANSYATQEEMETAIMTAALERAYQGGLFLRYTSLPQQSLGITSV